MSMEKELLNTFDKELLIKDLSSRLPYGVKCENFSHTYGRNVFKVTDIRDNGYICGIINDKYGSAVFDPLELKPYLFPLSSMTEEQRQELESLMVVITVPAWGKILSPTPEYYDWLNKNHFDYRGLIKKGLAIDATGLNIY